MSTSKILALLALVIAVVGCFVHSPYIVPAAIILLAVGDLLSSHP